jgi:hypothetical protein
MDPHFAQTAIPERQTKKTLQEFVWLYNPCNAHNRYITHHIVSAGENTQLEPNRLYACVFRCFRQHKQGKIVEWVATA